MNDSNPYFKNDFPSQKKSLTSKGKSWRMQCVDYGESIIDNNSGLRKSKKNMRINYDLFSDILDEKDVKNICNPMKVKGMNVPAKLQNYPIAAPKIELLIGEEMNKKFNWLLRTTNDDAISSKEMELRKMLEDLMLEEIQKGETEESEIKKRIEEFGKYSKFEYQDLRERRATFILKYLEQKLKTRSLFNKGFKDALIAGEEVYQIDIINDEPVMKRLNPLNVYTLRQGESDNIEDSDIITIEEYYSIGKVIDEYHNDLKPNEVSMIEKMNTDHKSSKPTKAMNSTIDIGEFKEPRLLMTNDESHAIDESVLARGLSSGSGAAYDMDGNVRVLKVYWKSLRKMKKVKYYDEFGDEQYDFYDENYDIDENSGEEESIVWVSEWWEGHKIGGSGRGKGIYTRMRPKQLQFNSINNPIQTHSGIVGTIYKTNDNVAMSLMDRMKPYQYMYNILMYNTELFISKNWGKIMKFPLNEIPKNWDMDKWMSFVKGMNISFIDMFKPGSELNPNINNAHVQSYNNVIDMEMGNSIQLYLDMAQYVKQELGEISGVNSQRQGQIESRELVGSVERAMTQTSHITEFWFDTHEQTKLRALTVLLEAGKIAYQGTNRKVQYVLDDLSTKLSTIDGDEFAESEYGLFITNGSENHRLMQSLKELAHAGIQNDKLNFSQLMDIYMSPDLASVRRRLEEAEQSAINREQEERQKELESQERISEQNAQSQQADRDQENLLNLRDNQVKLQVANVQARIALANSNNGEGDSNSSIEKLKQDAKKLEEDIRKSREDSKLANKQYLETVRSNKAKEQIERKKANSPKTSSTAAKK